MNVIHPELLHSYGPGFDFWLFDNCDSADISRWAVESWEQAERATMADEIEQCVWFARVCENELGYRRFNQPEPEYREVTVERYTSADMLRDAAEWARRDIKDFGNACGGVVSYCLVAVDDLMDLIKCNHMYEVGLGDDTEMYEKLWSKRELLRKAMTPWWKVVAQHQAELYDMAHLPHWEWSDDDFSEDIPF